MDQLESVEEKSLRKASSLTFISVIFYILEASEISLSYFILSHLYLQLYYRYLQLLKNEQIKPYYIARKKNPADILTKNLS